MAGRSQHAVRGAKKLIGSSNWLEAITAKFEKREPRFGDVEWREQHER